jgi:hypothetical protein
MMQDLPWGSIPSQGGSEMRKYRVTLEREEREKLGSIAQKGSHKSQRVINALVLLNCNEGQFQEHAMKNEDVPAVLRISMRKIDCVKRRFVEEGLETALTGRKGNKNSIFHVDYALFIPFQ